MEKNKTNIKGKESETVIRVLALRKRRRRRRNGVSIPWDSGKSLDYRNGELRLE